jgi:hypothetical protein
LAQRLALAVLFLALVAVLVLVVLREVSKGRYFLAVHWPFRTTGSEISHKRPVR